MVDSLFESVFDRSPDFINPEGIKWWKDKSITEYCHRKDLLGISLPDVTAWIIERPDGYRTHVLIENNAVIADAQSIEEIATKIDVFKLMKKFDGVEKEGASCG